MPGVVAARGPLAALLLAGAEGWGLAAGFSLTPEMELLALIQGYRVPLLPWQDFSVWPYEN